MGAEFDDGNREVPGGITGPVDRVVVVGAGISGLATANALRHAGVDCVVVEARERIGGRLHTVDVGGQPVDLGGSWIHHPVGNPVRALADLVGVACRDGEPTAEMAAYDIGESRRLTPDEVQAELAMLYDAFPAAIGDLRDQLGPLASTAEAIDAYVSGPGWTTGGARRARQGLRSVVEAESADRPENQSLAWMWNEHEYDGSYFGDLPDGGYERIIAALAEHIDVRTGFEVDAIVVGDDGVSVQGPDGAVETGSHVVVTVPLGVLKAGRPQFVPALPAERQAAMDRLGFGYLEKVVLRFEEPFWREAGLPHLMIYPGDPSAATVWMFGLDAFGGTPTLMVFAFHSDAERMRDTPPETRVAWALDLLTTATGRTDLRPLATAVTDWAVDPFSLGSYSHIAPGGDPSDADRLGEPLFGRLLFAGEHTQSRRLVYVDGAMASGVREAKRLLQRSSVELG